MGIPLKVLNRLRLGRVVASETSALQSGHRACVYVKPIVNETKGYWHTEHPYQSYLGTLSSALVCLGAYAL